MPILCMKSLADNDMNHPNSTSPIVCVHCLAYNHERYIEDAIKGFLMQQTNFPFIVVIVDDHSTDRTPDIIKAYQDMYPDVIKGILLEENYHSLKKSKDPFFEPYDRQAKYIAICEGDDFWTDQNKLQKQVDFLETHQDFSMCFHGADILNETQSVPLLQCESIQTREYFPPDVFPAWTVPTASLVYRKQILEYHLKRKEWQWAGDIVKIMQGMHTGRVWAFSEHMSVYRMNYGGMMHTQAHIDDHDKRLANHYRFLRINFPKIDKDYIAYFLSSYHYTQFRHSDRIFSKLGHFFCALYESPQYVMSKLTNHFSHK